MINVPLTDVLTNICQWGRTFPSIISQWRCYVKFRFLKYMFPEHASLFGIFPYSTIMRRYDLFQHDVSEVADTSGRAVEVMHAG